MNSEIRRMVPCDFCVPKLSEMKARNYTNNPNSDGWISCNGLVICPDCQKDAIIKMLKGEKTNAPTS